MARPAIVKKLNRELQTPIQTEAQVVYVLVEIRKVLEKDDAKEEYPHLTLHCDWAVHPKLKGMRARNLVKQVDESWDKLMPGGAGGGLDREEHHRLSSLLELGRFQDELLRFLQSEGLPEDICHGNTWGDFIKLYSNVVEDCPLVCVSEDVTLKHLDKIEISQTPGGFHFLQNGQQVLMSLTWRFYWKETEIGVWPLEPGRGILGTVIRTP